MEKLVNRIQNLEKDVKDINSLIDIINMIFDEKIEIIAERLESERRYQEKLSHYIAQLNDNLSKLAVKMGDSEEIV
jgi:hypothetical protein